jgi:putative flavoprotein involved in K+ transport
MLIEEGAASIALYRHPVRREAFDVIVIGGGQAGLSMGYHLARRGVHFVILDASERVGDSWRKRWDSLRLFTPAQFDGLHGMPFPAPRYSFPTKDEMANYLESYARRFKLPVRSGVRVERLFKRGERYVAQAGSVEFEAKNVVIAMSKYQVASVPEFAGSLSREIRQLHAVDYRNLSQLQPGDALLVGAGNTGADLALELARTPRKTFMAGRDPGEIPFRIERWVGRLLMPVILGFVFRHVLTVKTPPGRKARHAILTKGGGRIRVKARDITAAHVEWVPRVTGVRNGLPLLEDGRTLDVKNVIWCSGFSGGFDWIDLPVLDDHGYPKHESGVATDQPGVYFLGLPFLHSMSSSMIGGVGRDAARLARLIRS